MEVKAEKTTKRKKPIKVRKNMLYSHLYINTGYSVGHLLCIRQWLCHYNGVFK